MIELAKETMVGALSNEGINARKKEGNPQPYLASMVSVHQDNFTLEDIWTCEARTEHVSMLHHRTPTPQQCHVALNCVHKKIRQDNTSTRSHIIQVCQHQIKFIQQ